MPAASDEGIAGFGDIPNGYLASVEVAPGLMVFQQPGRAVVEAVDPATGRRLWTTKLPTPPGFTPDTTVSGALTLSLMAAGGVIAAYDSADYLWWVANAGPRRGEPTAPARQLRAGERGDESARDGRRAARDIAKRGPAEQHAGSGG